MGSDGLTPQERRLRLALRAGAVVFALETLAYLLPALVGSAADDWIQLPFVASSVSKAMLLAGVAWIAGADVRRFSPAVPIIYVGTAVWVVAAAAMLIWADTSVTYDVFGLELSIGEILLAGIVLETGLTVLFAWLNRSAQRARYRLAYLTPLSFRTLEALGEVLIYGEDERVPPAEIAANTDRYLSSFRARRKWIVQAAMLGLYLYPLLTLRPPMPLMSPEERLAFLRKRFLRAVQRRSLHGLWRTLTQAMIRLASQMTYLGYYSDPRSFEAVGYVPFSQRDRYAEDVAQAHPAERHVRALRPADLNGAAHPELSADAVVVGSGAAGAIIAAELAAAGKEVVVVERGEHVDPSDFTEDEAEMLTRLYADGALQLARDFRFQVLQGMCVGGSTVVNNAVCFEIPERVLRRWNEEHAAGLDPDRVADCFTALRQQLQITRQPTRYLNPGARKFTEGIAALGLDAGESGVVEANIAGCIGCGYCNIGCRFGKKLSMLDTVLPDAQHDHGDRLRILSECRAEGIERDYGRVSGVHCRLSDGRRLRVRAPLVVVSAGAVNSSFLLLRSGVGGPVGEGLSFNMASPLTAEFEEELRSYDGLQISHYLDPGEGAEFVAETWFNPVLSQALNMPGWFEDHYLNMSRYAHLTAAGALVGTERNGRVKKALLGGPDIVYKPTPRDLSRLLEGLKTLGRIYLAAGAMRVMPLTFQFREFRSERELERLDDLVRDSSDISLGTGHPQGGNAIGEDPATAVVDPGFRVHGTEGLYVCDASVFPTSLTVNPQMTVMALARYAADGILGRQGSRSPAPPAPGPDR